MPAGPTSTELTPSTLAVHHTSAWPPGGPHRTAQCTIECNTSKLIDGIAAIVKTAQDCSARSAGAAFGSACRIPLGSRDGIGGSPLGRLHNVVVPGFRQGFRKRSIFAALRPVISKQLPVACISRRHGTSRRRAAADCDAANPVCHEFIITLLLPSARRLSHEQATHRWHEEKEGRFRTGTTGKGHLSLEPWVRPGAELGRRGPGNKPASEVEVKSSCLCQWPRQGLWTQGECGGSRGGWGATCTTVMQGRGDHARSGRYPAEASC